MSEKELWTLNITAKSEIKVPTDVEELLLARHSGSRRAASYHLRRLAVAGVNFTALRATLRDSLRKDLTKRLARLDEEDAAAE